MLKEPLPKLRAIWEDTSFQLERLQANEICVKQEEEGLAKRTQPYFRLTFDPCEMPCNGQLSKTTNHKISLTQPKLKCSDSQICEIYVTYPSCKVPRERLWKTVVKLER